MKARSNIFRKEIHLICNEKLFKYSLDPSTRSRVRPDGRCCIKANMKSYKYDMQGKKLKNQ